MDIIRKTPQNCRGCPLLRSYNGWCHQYVPGKHFGCKSPSEARLLTLAEGPALWEKRQGRPLSPRGSAGSKFHRQLIAADFADTPRYLANVVMCTNLVRVKKKVEWETRTPPPEAVACCTPKWQRLVEIVQPEVILLLGRTAMGAFGVLDGRRESIFDVAPAGEPLTGTGWAPYVVATFHPSGLHAKTKEERERRGEHFRASFALVARLLSGDWEAGREPT